MQGFRQGLQDPRQRAIAHPALKAAMAGLVGRIAARQVVPGRAGPEYPQNAIQGLATRPPRPAPAILASRQGGQERGDDRPLRICQIHCDTSRRGYSLIITLSLFMR